MYNIKKNFINFWFSQLLSQLGSAITSYALTLWVYSKSNLAFDISILSFCSFVPYIIGSFIAGTFIDRYNKKYIIFIVDTLAVIGTIFTLLLISLNQLTVIFISIINIIIGFANAFQIPAVTVVTERLNTSENYTKASGMLSFSDALIFSFSSAIATILYKTIGIEYILIIDIVTYFLANIILIFFINIPRDINEFNYEEESFFNFIKYTKEGFSFIFSNKALFKIIFSMCLMNFFSHITYENILPAMIISRSNSEYILGIVNIFIGIGGILGGFIVSIRKLKGNMAYTMYFFLGITFLFGDLSMAFGRNLYSWIPAAIFASFPIPFIIASQRSIIYTHVPKNKQGRIFATKNAIQHCLIPVGILLGGYLADNIFEPLIVYGNSDFGKFLFNLFGATHGAGMATMFFITGILGFLFSIYMLTNKDIIKLGNI